jgi:hypothetical protein
VRKPAGWYFKTEEPLNLLEPERISIVPSAFEKRVARLRAKLLDDLNRTIHVCDLARRRVLKGETIENGAKLFSLSSSQIRQFGLRE